MVKLLKRIFLDILYYFKYKLFEFKKSIFKINKRHLAGINIKIGEKVNWKRSLRENKEFFPFIVKIYGKGPFEVLDIEENECMARIIYKEGKVTTKQIPVRFLVKPKEGRQKGNNVWIESDLLFEETLYVYKQI